MSQPSSPRRSTSKLSPKEEYTPDAGGQLATDPLNDGAGEEPEDGFDDTETIREALPPPPVSCQL